MAHLVEDAFLERPWSAEIATPVDGTKPKYNLPLVVSGTADAQLLANTLMQSSAGQQPARSPSTRKLKEKWASEAAKGVDYDRAPAALVEVAEPRQSATLVQVPAASQTCRRARSTRSLSLHAAIAAPCAGIPHEEPPAVWRSLKLAAVASVAPRSSCAPATFFVLSADRVVCCDV